MSKLSRVLVRCLALALLATVVAGASVGAAQELQAAAASPTVAEPGRIGVIDIGRLVETSETGRRALAELEALQVDKKARFDALAAEGEALESQVREGELTLAEEKMIALRQQLEDKKIEISRFGADSQRELEKAQLDMFNEIQEKVFPIIDEVGREGDFSLIFRKFESGLVFADEGVDITDRVIARLDGGAANEG